MLKRRVAIVVTAAALGLTGMAGSALAADGSNGDPGEGLVRVHGPGERAVHGGRLTCWMNDGKIVKFSKAKVAELVEEEFIEPELAESVTEEGVTTVPADRLSISVPARELPRKAGKRWHRGRVVHLTCVWDEHVRR
ncbi:hypothetical protein [Nonomuraea zeae]|uniref:Uncharacterized protein n=1 Tax=Nonomuraea zeae TaxID=1642303 RepID=A0A5S4FMQ1_9ACTN|nr:hypothetical protein [Nonomuraea zeae]TMR21471.1 hypothetical protein ETD85_50855 [Nonomuraea zeae]